MLQLLEAGQAERTALSETLLQTAKHMNSWSETSSLWMGICSLTVANSRCWGRSNRCCRNTSEEYSLGFQRSEVWRLPGPRRRVG